MWPYHACKRTDRPPTAHRVRTDRSTLERPTSEPLVWTSDPRATDESEESKREIWLKLSDNSESIWESVSVSNKNRLSYKNVVFHALNMVCSLIQIEWCRIQSSLCKMKASRAEASNIYQKARIQTCPGRQILPGNIFSFFFRNSVLFLNQNYKYFVERDLCII